MLENTPVPAMSPNSPEALVHRRDTGTLTWRGPALMLFARSLLAVGAQALVAAVFILRSSPTPWHDAEPYLRSAIHGRSDAVADTVFGLRNALVPASSPPGSLCDSSRADGRCERGDRGTPAGLGRMTEFSRRQSPTFLDPSVGNPHDT